MTFRVKQIPDPVITLNGKKSGSKLPAAFACLQIAPAAVLLDFDFDCKFNIDSFTIIIIKDRQMSLMRNLHNPYGARFTDDPDVAQAMKLLRPGDKLLLTDITCKGPDGKERHLQPVEFFITDTEE